MSRAMSGDRASQSRDREKLRNNAAGRRKRLPHRGQVVGMHWWDRLQPVNARLRAHFFSPSEGAISSKKKQRARRVKPAAEVAR
jgi:hypothetical protein